MTGASPLLEGNRPIRILLVAGFASSLRNFRGPLIKEMIPRGYEVDVAAPCLMRKIQPVLFLGYTLNPVIGGLMAARLARVPCRVALVMGLGYALTGQAGGKCAIIMALTRGHYELLFLL